MGRELRRVPPDWEHPKDEHGHWIPHHEWFSQDEEGIRELVALGQLDPSKPHYGCHLMPAWPFSERTHFQYYEVTTEGTPLSPVFATLEVLALWCFEDSKRPGTLLGTRVWEKGMGEPRPMTLDDWCLHLRGELQLWYERARNCAHLQYLADPRRN